MTDIINAFLSAQTIKEVNDIVSENIDTLNAHPRLFSFARGARRRINHLRRTKIALCEIIYLN
jgi:hypothetical protein